MKLNIFKNKGYTIVFLGTDGSGKTTIIDRVTPFLNEKFPNNVYYEHLRPNWIPTISKLLGRKGTSKPETDPHRNDKSGVISSLFRFIYYFVDYTLGYWFKIYPKKAFKSCVWIFDRYYYEYLIDQRRTRVTLPYWILKAGQFLIPEPDLIICLGANPKAIYSRKPEMTLEEVTRQVNELSAFCKKHKNAVWVDTSCTVEHSVKSTLDAIKRKLHTVDFQNQQNDQQCH